MKNLIKELKAKNSEQLSTAIKRYYEELKDKDNALTFTEKYTLNRREIYKGDRHAKVKNRLKEVYKKRLDKELYKVEEINNADNKMPNDLVLIVNFYKNRTWGYCPKGTDNYGHSTDSITGYGYCKESTATAQLLNQNKTILKALYKAKNKKPLAKNNDLLGYGSGYGILPSFEGGVGLSSHIRILENLGYKVSQSGNNTNTIVTISK